jgi:adhesin transport system membrane fusion protein
VEAGQPLITLDRTETGSTLAINQAEGDALDARIARLRAEATGRAPQFPDPDDPAAAEQVEIERNLYRSRQANLAATLSAARARVAQASRAVSQAQSQLESRRSAQAAAQSQLDAIRPLVERRIEPQVALNEAENRLRAAQSDVSAASADVSRASAAVAEAQAEVSRLQQDWRSAAADELAAAQSDLATKNRARPALAERLQRTTVRAPVKGQVNRVLKRTVGGTVAPGETLVEIVPSDDALLVAAQIRPEDIGWVAIGQQAKVNVTAYDSTVYGGLEGEVTTISPDARMDERTGERFYEVLVRTQRSSIRTAGGNELPIGAGMTAEVNLIGEQRSILDYLLRPITRLRERAFRE